MLLFRERGQTCEKEMPHRTTYFFPRQFPDRGSFDSSSSSSSSNKQLWDHEKKMMAKHTFNTETDSRKAKEVVSNPIIKPSLSSLASSDYLSFTGGVNKSRSKKKQQLAAFYDCLVVKKGDSNSNNKSSSSPYHVKSRFHDNEAERELFLPPPSPQQEPAVTDRNLDRHASLQRFSSGSSSYAGSLFSGTTNLSSDIVKESRTTTAAPTTRRKEDDDDDQSKDSLAQKSKESYYLQLMLAKRLTSQASLATESASDARGGVNSNAETVSYRLWVLFSHILP